MTAAMSDIVLSIVASMYRSENVIEEFVSRVAVCAQEITGSYEIILVNDGCPGASLQVALETARKHDKIKIIDLSRNFGHHPAMMSGLSQAAGKYVYLTNIDLEERPENLREIWGAFQNYEQKNGDGKTPVDVVYGKETERKGGFNKRVLGGSFYALFNWLSDVQLPKGQIVSRVMSRRYVDSLLQFHERDIFMQALWELAGFTQRPIPLQREEAREKSTYTIWRRLHLAVRAITSFSSKPLQLIFYAGLLISASSALLILFLVLQRWLWGGLLEGWTSVMVAVFLMGGLIIFSIGIVGIYLSRMFLEIKGRPTHIIRSVYKSSDDRYPHDARLEAN